MGLHADLPTRLSSLFAEVMTEVTHLGERPSSDST
jgi:hypothetical protein